MSRLGWHFFSMYCSFGRFFTKTTIIAVGFSKNSKKLNESRVIITIFDILGVWGEQGILTKCSPPPALSREQCDFHGVPFCSNVVHFLAWKFFGLFFWKNTLIWWIFFLTKNVYESKVFSKKIAILPPSPKPKSCNFPLPVLTNFVYYYGKTMIFDCFSWFYSFISRKKVVISQKVKCILQMHWQNTVEFDVNTPPPG